MSTIMTGRASGLAGVPREVVQRASGILAHLEEHAVRPDAGTEPQGKGQAQPRPKQVQMSLFQPLDAEVREELLKLDVDALTPIEALQRLVEIKRRLEEGRAN